MTKPLISIITVTYNASSTLPPTMESIANQTFRDFEHIIVDGDSTDDTIAIARRLGRDDIIIHEERDTGLYDAMNKGLRIAKGDFVIFINAGDAFHTSDTLQVYADACRDSDIDIVYADTDIVDSARRRIGPRHKTAPETLTPESWLGGMLVCHQAFMVRRDIVLPFSLKWRFSSDYEWTLDCIEATTPERCRNLHIVAIDYLNEGQTTTNHRKSLWERFRIMMKHFGLCATLKSHYNFIVGKA